MDIHISVDVLLLVGSIVFGVTAFIGIRKMMGCDYFRDAYADIAFLEMGLFGGIACATCIIILLGEFISKHIK